jgi:hypothetical protein
MIACSAISIDGQSSDELDESPRVVQGRAVTEADQRRPQRGDPARRAAILGRVGGEEARGFAEADEPGRGAEIGQDVAEK